MNNKSKFYWSLIVLIELILLALIFAACSPQKKLARLYKNNPELFENEKVTELINYKDTVTIELPGKSRSNSFHILELRDTIYIEDTLFSIQMYHDTIHDTIYMNTDIPVRTIYVPIDVDVPCVTNIHRRPRDSLIRDWLNALKWYHYMFISMILLTFISIVNSKNSS